MYTFEKFCKRQFDAFPHVLRLFSTSKKIELADADLEVSFVRGWGPGGQHVNRTSNCVVMRHIPTGIVVKCQEFRVLEDNKREARRRMLNALDIHYNGEDSQVVKQKVQDQKRDQESKRRSKQRIEMKKNFKEKLDSLSSSNYNDFENK